MTVGGVSVVVLRMAGMQTLIHHLHGISPAKCRYIQSRASSSQQVVVVVLVVQRGQCARSRGVLLLMSHTKRN
jgi:hypothetical protein